MPKQLYKIVGFHGGLNSNSDARDIAENELSEATDVMVDELGKIRLMGGNTPQGAAARTNQISPGHGLFQFSHDRRDGHTAAAGTEVETDYLAFSEPDTAGTIDIYSNEDTTWGSPITGMDDNGVGLRKDVFYVADGALRVCDSEFGNDNDNKWYGYINRYQFGDNATGVDDFSGTNGMLYNQWKSTNQELTALALNIVEGEHTDAATQDADINDPIWVKFSPRGGSSSPRWSSLSSGGFNSTHTQGGMYVKWDAPANTITTVDSGGTAENQGLENFISEGDYIYVCEAADTDNNKTIFIVEGIDVSGSSDILTVSQMIDTGSGVQTTQATADLIKVTNLSRIGNNSGWFDPESPYLYVGVTTLYDDNKQESAMSNIKKIHAQHLLGSVDSRCDMQDLLFYFNIWTTTGNTFGSTYPRVSGFKVYLNMGGPDWFLYYEVDITKGGRFVELDEEDSYEMWSDSLIETNNARISQNSPGTSSNFPAISTYRSETGNAQ